MLTRTSRQTTLSNESGTYNFPVLQPGTYEVSADLTGFKKVVNNEVELPYAGQIRLNFTLEVGRRIKPSRLSRRGNLC